jgi:hypothetical protein
VGELQTHNHPFQGILLYPKVRRLCMMLILQQHSTDAHTTHASSQVGKSTHRTHAGNLAVDVTEEHPQALHEQAPRGWTHKLKIDSLFWLVVQVP